MTFKIGDVVQLKSGGPLMTVSKKHYDCVSVIYTSMYNIEQAYIEPKCLKFADNE